MAVKKVWIRIIAVLIPCLAFIVCHHSVWGVCFNKKCKQILVWGTILNTTPPTNKCTELLNSDCLKCINYWCVAPAEGTLTNCVVDPSLPYKYRDCPTDCSPQCKGDTTGDQEATCTSSGGDWVDPETHRWWCTLPTGG